MGLGIETVEADAGPSINAANLAAKFDKTALINEIIMEAKLAIAPAIEQSMRYAETMKTDLMASVKTELQAWTKPQQQILVVKIDEIKRKLSKPASPYLGEVLLQGKIGMNTMLVGPAGCGKTTLAEQAAEAMGLRYGHISLTQGASETWLVGRWSPGGEFINAEFTDFFENGGVFLIDEFDASDANLLLLINTALANGTLYNPMNGKKHKRHKDFVCIAACNTHGKGGNMVYTGRSRLDGAALNRFACGTIEMEYAAEIEKPLCPDAKLYKLLLKTRKFLKEKQSTEMITTRELMNAYALKCQGLTEKRIFEKMTASWPLELRTQSPLFQEQPEETTPPKGDDLPF